MAPASNTTVLVTGGSGFLGSCCCITLLHAGYQVRTTIRSLSKASATKQTPKNGGLTNTDLNRLTFIEAIPTMIKAGIRPLQGCTSVLHVASPIPTAEPKDVSDLIIPAHEGTLRVLCAATNAGSVKRDVLTSSFNVSCIRPSRST